MIVAGSTRWGTQVGMLQSLKRTKEALREFVFRHDVDIKFKDKVIQHQWWAYNTDLLAILEPIHKLQKISEANKANIVVGWQGSVRKASVSHPKCKAVGIS